MDVGIRELKARLSEYLDRVERGEVIRVTDRGKPKALISPLAARGRIDQGIREGWIRPGSGGRLKPLRRRFQPKRSVKRILDEDRGD